MSDKNKDKKGKKHRKSHEEKTAEAARAKKLGRKEYESELERLHVELVRLQQ